MLLTITTTRDPATDLGYLLHKHPARFQSFGLSFGPAHVFYPEATPVRCTAALLLDVDLLGLVRRKGYAPSAATFGIDHYVSDRPYVASSYLSVAIAEVFGSALAGRCKDRPELVDQKLPLEAGVVALRCAEGEPLLRELFEPLGYDVTVSQHDLDAHVPAWGRSPYFTLRLRAECRLQDLLAHLYVLVPVLDDQKHYWVSEDEITKLLKRGEGWLAEHPHRELITRRYLKHQRVLVRDALTRLLVTDGRSVEMEVATGAQAEEQLEVPLRLGQTRLSLVAQLLHESGAQRVLDLGCGEGKLLQKLIEKRSVQEVVGVDVSQRSLEVARGRLRLDAHDSLGQGRVKLLQGSLTYRDRRLQGYDAAVLMEAIEHIDPSRLPALEDAVFGFAGPAVVVVTTPNAEYNALFADLPSSSFRHPDHRFEWTRQQFQAWAGDVAARYDYTAEVAPVGPAHPDLGAPTQMGVFRR